MTLPIKTNQKGKENNNKNIAFLHIFEQNVLSININLATKPSKIAIIILRLSNHHRTSMKIFK